MSTLMDILISRRSEILALAASKGLKDIRVFGSVARGDDTPESDVDFLVNIADANDPLAFIDFQEEVSKMISRKVDIVFERGLYHALRERVISEARTL